MPAKKLGTEVRKSYSIRFEPRIVKKVTEKYGSLTAFVNRMLKEKGFLKEGK